MICRWLIFCIVVGVGDVFCTNPGTNIYGKSISPRPLIESCRSAHISTTTKLAPVPPSVSPTPAPTTTPVSTFSCDFNSPTTGVSRVRFWCGMTSTSLVRKVLSSF